MGCVSSKQNSPAERTAASTQTDQEAKPPSLKPPRKNRDKLIPNSSVFSQTDEHAKGRIPFGVANSVQSLANHLTSKCPDDLHKVRAIFCWIAANIAYDIDGKRSETRPSQDAESVLRSRRAVCQGYSELCLALCRAAGVPCVLVYGQSKGFEHEPGTVYKLEVKHAWNLVKVKGEWRPLDCTWGAGHVEKGGHFVREFAEHWFLTDPKDFLLSHFPYLDNEEDSRPYQLVSRPIGFQEFNDNVKPEGPALKIGLRFLTHTRAQIDVVNDVTIKVKVKAGRSPLECVKAHLTSANSRNKQDGSGVVTSLQDDGTCCVYVRPPAAAEYHLTVMGRTRDMRADNNKLYHLVTYVIKGQGQGQGKHLFPNKTGMYGRLEPTASECGLKRSRNAPFKFTAKAGHVTIPVPFSRPNVRVQPELYHALDKDMKKDLARERYTLTEYTDGGATIRARLPRPGYYLLRVFASQPDGGQTLHQAVDLLLFTDRELKDCQPFPQPYKFADTHKVRLLQPQAGTVAPGVKTKFRVYAPDLVRVKVAGMEMTKKKNAWEAEVCPNPGDREVSIFGATQEGAVTLNGLYKFDVARARS